MTADYHEIKAVIRWTVGLLYSEVVGIQSKCQSHARSAHVIQQKPEAFFYTPPIVCGHILLLLLSILFNHRSVLQIHKHSRPRSSSGYRPSFHAILSFLHTAKSDESTNCQQDTLRSLSSSKRHAHLGMICYMACYDFCLKIRVNIIW